VKTGHIICGIALVALMNCVSFVLGQEQGGFAGNKVTNLTKSDLVGVPNKQVIANIYEVPAGAMVPRHFHHGDEFHLVLAGEWAAEVEGRPIKNLKTGVKFGRKPKLTPHQQQEALVRRARGDALGLTSPDPMQSHTQLSHVSRNKVGQTAIYLRQSGPFTTTGRPHPVMAMQRNLGRFAS
jgi:hypothetical protein